jgi:putative hydrolase of the HAD superfamily
MPIRVISLDAGGTLIEPLPSVGHVYAQVAAEHGEADLDPDELTRHFLRQWKEKKDFGYTRACWRNLAAKTFQRGRLEFFDQLYQRFTRADVWRVYPDVFPALRELREAGLQLAVISNWDERLRPLLAELGLDPFFDVITISLETGCQKPAPEIFQKTAASLGIMPGEMLHVGDSWAEDLEGAIGAGMKGLLLDRSGERRGSETITSLGDLLPLIRKGRWIS